MSYVVLAVLCFSISFLIKESDGPFHILYKIRLFLISKSEFFARLFLCYYCVGFYSGLISYFLLNSSFNLKHFIVYGLFGAGVSYLISRAIDTNN